MRKYEDGAQLRVNAREIKVVPGHNPRTHFDEGEMRELEELIEAQGVLQPLLVREAEDGGFQLIAGERRLRASRKVLGEDAMVPVMVRVCREADMKAMAISENTGRAAMSPANEAEGAHALMILMKGDKDSVARSVGWTLAKLERRLALMQACAEVREALSRRQIDLGHAELLAAVPRAQQVTALKTIIEKRLSVAVLRKEIGKIAHALADAVFDKGDCAGCQYSSANQAALFSEAIGAGYCTNESCWTAKTNEQLDVVVAALKEEVPRVEIIRADGAVDPIKLAEDGPVGVGAEQARACRGCQNFGCTVSGMAGTVGTIERSICFDATCHTSKVAVRVRQVQAEAEAARLAAEAVKAKGGTHAEEARAATDAKKRVRQSTAGTPAAGAISSRLKDYRSRVWRQTASRAAFADSNKSRDLLITLALTGKTRHIDQIKLGEALAKLAGKQVGVGRSVKDVASSVVDLHERVKSNLVNALAASAMANVEERDLCGSLAFMGVKLSAYWHLNEEYLGLLTKSEIWAVCAEVGLVEAMGAEKFKTAMAGKKEDFVKACLSVKGFNYERAVPQNMHWDVQVDTEACAGGGSSEEGEEEGQEGAEAGGAEAAANG